MRANNNAASRLPRPLCPCSTFALLKTRTPATVRTSCRHKRQREREQCASVPQSPSAASPPGCVSWSARTRGHGSRHGGRAHLAPRQEGSGRTSSRAAACAFKMRCDSLWAVRGTARRRTARVSAHGNRCARSASRAARAYPARGSTHHHIVLWSDQGRCSYEYPLTRRGPQAHARARTAASAAVLARRRNKLAAAPPPRQILTHTQDTQRADLRNAHKTGTTQLIPTKQTPHAPLFVGHRNG